MMSEGLIKSLNYQPLCIMLFKISRLLAYDLVDSMIVPISQPMLLI